MAYTPLAEARDIAYEYRKTARAGGDPTVSCAGSTVPTFADLAERVIEAHRGGWKENGKSEENWRSSLQRYAYPRIGAVPVDEITTADLCGSCSRSGTTSARRPARSRPGWAS